MENKKDELYQYLISRGINDPFYLKILQNGISENEYLLCSADGYDFLFSHLLDESELAGYGLIITNQYLHTQAGHEVAIGLVEGDDVICIDVRDGTINLWLVENGSGEHIKVASSFFEFWQMIIPCHKKEHDSNSTQEDE